MTFRFSRGAADTFPSMLRARGTRSRVALVLALAAAASLPASAFAAVPSRHTPGPLSPALSELANPSFRTQSRAEQMRQLGIARRGPGSLLREGRRVLVYVRFEHGALAALPELRRANARIVAASRPYQRVTASVLPGELEELGNIPGVVSVQPVRAPISRAPDCEGGSVISEGVQQLNVEGARTAFPGADGAGLTVGVLSDSFDQATTAVGGGPLEATAEDDEASADLPGPGNECAGQEEPVNELEPYEPSPTNGEEEPFDEGRGMLQIVHDIAPQADLAFHTAFNGEDDFAEGIRELAKSPPFGAGAQVIVDDVAYFEEPFFQDGPVAAAVDEVTSGPNGATYLSAAGNDNLFDEEGNEIASWEAPSYRDSGSCPQEVRELPGFNAHHCLDFNPGAATDRTFGIKVEPEEILSIDLQWAEPWFGVETDLDAFLLDAEGHLLTGSVEENEVTGQPTEIVQWENPSSSTRTVQLVVNRFSGPAAVPLKFILLQNGGGVTGVEYPKSGNGDVVGPSLYGHAGAASAIGVGAMRFAPRIGEGAEEPEFYSSRGPVTHYFEPVEGTSPAAPLPAAELISKPDVTATDCGKTTFFARKEGSVWRFCGTSAAAPHAAGIAALMLDEEGAASPGEIREALAASASPIDSFGPCAVGGGLVEAKGAVEAILAGPPFAASEECEPPESPPGAVFVAPGNWGLEDPPAVPTPTPPQPPTPTPPNTAFAQRPKKTVRIRGRSVKLVFRFRSDQSGVTFLCKVDAGAFRACGVKLVRRYKPGKHVVKVKARSSAGLTDPTPAVFRFTVKRIA